jgi:transcriptional regulator with XRE-family HTH domain
VTAQIERMFVLSLGHRIRFLRRLRRLTTQELATRSAVPLSTVNAIESGERVASVVMLLHLAAALHVPWVALTEPAQADAERLLREAWGLPDQAGPPPRTWAGSAPKPEHTEGLPS